MSRRQSSPQQPRRLPWWGAVVAAAAGGLLLDAATPELAWWWAAFPAVLLILAGCWQQRTGVGILAGTVAGAAFWGPHISWLTLYLGPVPWLGLCVVMVLWMLVFGLVVALATRGLARVPQLSRRPWALVLGQAATAAGLWVLREQAQGSWPYGGFAWGRVATTQADGPLAQAVSWTGFAGLTGAVVFACALVVAALAQWVRAQRNDPTREPGGATRVPGGAPGPGSHGGRPGNSWNVARDWPIIAPVVIVLALVALPAVPLPQDGTIRVAAVQGNSRSAIFDDRESGAVLQDHLDATEVLLAELEATGDSVDVIVWPENSGEFELRDNPLGSYRVARLAQRADAPILVGSILRDADGSYSNSSLVWTPDGPSGQRYDKRYPVPFAEYMPNRDFFHALAPDLVDLVQLDYAAGMRSPVLEIDTVGGGEGAPENGSGSTRDIAVSAGIAICFDIIFDTQAVAMVDDGAQVIFGQTNNADFGRTDESAQQLAIARLRAIETGRALVNISTVGTSAIVAPDGTDLDRLTPYTADALVAEVPLVTGKTPALRFGAAVAWAWGLIGAAGAVTGVTALWLRRQGQ